MKKAMMATSMVRTRIRMGILQGCHCPQTAGSQFKDITPAFLRVGVGGFWSFDGSWLFAIVGGGQLQIVIGYSQEES